MTTNSQSADSHADTAAVFGCALSLWQAVHTSAAADRNLNLSECYNGIDQLMREVMRIGSLFETWACEHVAFDELNDVWPYFLEDKFGDACMAIIQPGGLVAFDGRDCLRVAVGLRLAIFHDDALALPLDVRRPNPVSSSAFRELRIQTIRNSLEDGEIDPFTLGDVLDDDEYGPVYYGLYGVAEDGLLEHIADRQKYLDAVSLAEKLAPGVAFPRKPIFDLTESLH